MNRHLMFLALTMCVACKQPAERTIPYLPDVPIEERLEPGDTRVIVEMKAPDEPRTPRKESFEQEIQRLKQGEIIAVVRVASSAGAIADRGTWIRTTVNADVERIVRAQARRLPGTAIQFSYAGGSARLRGVEVTTGKFPRFVDGQRYLLILQIRRGTADSLMWNGIGFAVNDAGALQRIRLGDGSEQPLPTTLVGRDLSEVVEALAR